MLGITQCDRSKSNSDGSVFNVGFEESHYIGYDGTQMYMSTWLPDNDQPRAVMIAVHGLGTHGGIFRGLAEYFAKRGLAVFVPDMRGFGHYSGLKGHVMSFNEYIEDLQNIVMQVKDRHPNRLTFLLGHSLGAQHVIRYLVTYPKEVDGAIIQCPAVSERLSISPFKKLAGHVLSLLNVKVYFKNQVDLSVVSHDPEVQRYHETDPLRFDRVTARFGISGLRAAEEAFRAAPLIQVPVLLQQAGDDRLVDTSKSKLFFDGLASEDKSWIQYEGFYHEIFSEVGKERVLGDVEKWLEKRLVA